MCEALQTIPRGSGQGHTGGGRGRASQGGGSGQGHTGRGGGAGPHRAGGGAGPHRGGGEAWQDTGHRRRRGRAWGQGRMRHTRGLYPTDPHPSLTTLTHPPQACVPHSLTMHCLDELCEGGLVDHNELEGCNRHHAGHPDTILAHQGTLTDAVTLGAGGRYVCVCGGEGAGAGGRVCGIAQPCLCIL